MILLHVYLLCWRFVVGGAIHPLRQTVGIAVFADESGAAGDCGRSERIPLPPS